MKIYSANISGSLSVTGSVNIVTAPNVPIQGIIATASYISPTFISASAAASGFGTGGGGGPESDPIFAVWSASVASQFAGTASFAQTARTATTASYSTTLGAEIINPQAGTIRLRNSNSNTISTITDLTASLSTTALTASSVSTLTQNVTINGNLQVFGTASYTFISASQLNVSNNTISVNVFEPQQRFGGLIVYDSGSSAATASLLWDSLNNKWIYQNVSGSGYDGGMAIFGPRNTSGLGNEVGTTNNALMKGQGGDHITSSRIFDNGTIVYTTSDVQITGSLSVTAGVTASLLGTAATASYIDPLYISSSAASYGFGTGGGSGVTSITAGTGISVDQPTGAVTISATGTAGTDLGLVYAVSLGYLMP